MQKRGHSEIEDLNSPQAQNSYAWSSEDFKKFYSAVELYKDHQFGNKKIAKYMGDVANVQVDAA